MDALAKRLAEKCLKYGDFTVRGGAKSKVYFDKFLFLTDPDLLAAVASALIDRHLCKWSNFGRYAAPELGAVPLAAAVALEENTSYVIIRNGKKAHGTGNRIEGLSVEGRAVCLLEDVVTTGGAVIEAVAALKAAGATVTRIACVVDRQAGGAARILAETGVPLTALYTFADLGVPPEAP